MEDDFDMLGEYEIISEVTGGNDLDSPNADDADALSSDSEKKYKLNPGHLSLYMKKKDQASNFPTFSGNICVPDPLIIDKKYKYFASWSLDDEGNKKVTKDGQNWVNGFIFEPIEPGQAVLSLGNADYNEDIFKCSFSGTLMFPEDAKPGEIFRMAVWRSRSRLDKHSLPICYGKLERPEKNSD